jgi:hypothetical protein
MTGIFYNFWVCFLVFDGLCGLSISVAEAVRLAFEGLPRFRVRQTLLQSSKRC